MTSDTTLQGMSCALVEDDVALADLWSQVLRAAGLQVSVYADSDDLLADPAGFEHDLFVADHGLPGVSGVDLIRILRRRSQGGVLMATASVEAGVLADALEAGADMVLFKPVTPRELVAALRALRRRCVRADSTPAAWQLNPRTRRLLAPNGRDVELSSTQTRLLEMLAEVGSEPLARDRMLEGLGLEGGPSADGRITSAIYRLRRAVEAGTALALPLQSSFAYGYVFRAPLRLVATAGGHWRTAMPELAAA